MTKWRKAVGAALVVCLLFSGCGQRDYRPLLASYRDFNRSDARDVVFTYEFDAPELRALDETYGLRDISGAGDVQTRALRLLHWLCAHTHHDNPKRLPENVRLQAMDLLGWAFGSKKNGLNCKHLSIVLSECLLAVGIQARVLYCYPKVYKNDNHVVVEVWLSEEERWIMLDPSWEIFLSDEAGKILGVREIRELLASGQEPRLNPEAQKDGAWYLWYLAKDMFYFDRARETRYGVHDFGGGEPGGTIFISLCPAGYDLNPDEGPVYAAYDSFWK
ncbi:MAG: transglutaminase-like domain-containing protein [Oscillospiraceae bacterium]|jgi:hypothetical protein|nr:transglutaminase-like domain-containing protein [Oscillospiraceae bacterium]